MVIFDLREKELGVIFERSKSFARNFFRGQARLFHPHSFKSYLLTKVCDEVFAIKHREKIDRASDVNEPLKNVIELVAFKFFVHGEFHKSYEMFNLVFIIKLVLIIFKPVRVGFNQAGDKVLHFVDRYETCSPRVVLAPTMKKDVHISLFNWHFLSLCLSSKCVDHDSDEQIQKDLTHDIEEDHEIGTSYKGLSAAVSNSVIIIHNAFIIGVLVTLKQNGLSSHGVHHNAIPSFTCGTAEQKKERGVECLKIGMSVHLILVLKHCKSEKLIAQDCKKEQKEEQNTTEAAHSW